ncbi:MAG: PHP domain-containing protein [Granulosicoccaceae bacterium]|jgi:predicted metal-dependent phosphoesterase TrpH
MRIDLHSHSTVSDGTLTPAALVAHARAQNLDVLALTDHDVVDGIQAAQQAAGSALYIVPGVEISVSWRGQTVHIVGLHVDPEHPGLLQGLAGLREFRVWRAQEIARRLAKKGVPGALEGAQAWASGSLIGRTHFARFLVEHGYCESLREVFKRYLVRGKPGYVPGQWASLEDAVGWIRDAGGVAVIAHPARYRLTATRLRALIADFQACGGEGLEVVSGSHSRDEVLAMAEHSRRHGLLASCGSDYHGPENPWVELGRLAALPEDLVPVWHSPNWRGPVEAAV